MCTLDLQDEAVNRYINFASNQLFGKEDIKISDFNPDKLLKEDFLRFNNFRDWFSMMETANNEGIAEGEARGRAEGELHKALQIAMNLKESGMSAEQIADVTGLTIEQIMKI